MLHGKVELTGNHISFTKCIEKLSQLQSFKLKKYTKNAHVEIFQKQGIWKAICQMKRCR